MRNTSIRTLYLSASMALVVGMASCATLDPYTGEKQTSKAAKGAGIGALIGAVAGAATGDDSADRRRRALIGAGAGALAGTAVGAYMDHQEMKLRQQLEGTGVSVTRQGDNVILNMPSNVTFDSGETVLKPAFDNVLKGVTMVLKEYDKTVIEVAGHTDSDGENRMNQDLSEGRASAVASALLRNGVGERRIVALGFGELRPVATNSSDAGKTLNRRVELTLMPLTAG